MPTTPRMSLPYPAQTDPANIPLDFQELAEQLAGLVAGWLPSDTVANRPSASATYARHLFYAHDTNELFACLDEANDGTYVWSRIYPVDPPDLSPYATKTELSDGLSGKADSAHNHDSRYYTETEVDTFLSGKLNVDRTITPVPLRITRSGKDANGIFTVVEEHRVGGNRATRSVLSGGTSPRYTTRTVTEYGLNGTTVLRTTTYSLSYDADDDLTSEVTA